MSEELVLGTKTLGFPWETADPFLFCVYHKDDYPAGNEKMGPAVSLTGRQLGQDFQVRDGFRMYHGEVVPGFPQHPHRGFETVTVVRRGLVDHSDSLGATARYGEGDVQWLTAGAGIQHAEMFPLLDRKAGNPLELFQIWLNLPKVDKFAPPYFAMLWDNKIPRKIITDPAGRKTEITVIAGAYEKVKPPAPPPKSWASRADSDVAIWTVRMAPGASVILPPARKGTNRTLYFFAGDKLRVGGHVFPEHHGLELRPDVAVPLEAGSTEVDILILQGRPIGEPVVQYGPFVMNTRQEIEQAFADYQKTQFGGWPWKNSDPVHVRDKGRFAKHADGRIEKAV